MVNTLARIQYRTVKKGRAIKYIVFKFIGWLDSQALEKKIARLKLKAGMNNAE
jgi:plasmid replication initiation protein